MEEQEMNGKRLYTTGTTLLLAAVMAMQSIPYTAYAMESLDGFTSIESNVIVHEEDSAVETAQNRLSGTSQVFMGTGNGMMVRVIAPAQAFPENTTMKVTGVSSASVMDAVNDAVEGEVDKVRAVDISFYDGSR